MKSEDELRRATATAETGADFRAERIQGLAMITPLNKRASVWLKSVVSDDARWTDDTLIVEMRYFPNLVDAVIDQGFLFERDAYPN